MTEVFYGESLRSSKCNGLWLGPPPAMHTKDGDNTKLIVEAPSDLVLGGRVVVSAAIDSELTPASLIVSPAIDTHYYVYAYASGGAIAYEIDATGPDATVRFNSADNSRRYIGSFRTNHTGALVPFTMIDGDYTFAESAAAASGGQVYFKCLVNGTSTSAVIDLKDTGLSAYQTLPPPHARLVKVRTKLSCTSSSTFAVVIRNGDTLTNGDDGTGSGRVLEFAGSSSGGASYENFEIRCDSSQRLKYSATAGGHLDMWCTGWKERS